MVQWTKTPVRGTDYSTELSVEFQLGGRENVNTFFHQNDGQLTKHLVGGFCELYFNFLHKIYSNNYPRIP